MSLDHALARHGVEAVGRLIENQQFWTVRQCLRQLDELLHAQRVSADLAVAHFTKPDVKQRLMRSLQRLARGQSGQLRHVAHESHSGHVADEGVVLRHVADALADLRPVEPRIHAKYCASPPKEREIRAAY